MTTIDGKAPCHKCKWSYILDRCDVVCRCDPRQEKLLGKKDYEIIERQGWCEERN